MVRRFKLLGQAMAKALQDSRMLDMALSPVFLRIAAGRKVDLYDVRAFDAALGHRLERLEAALRAPRPAGTPLLVDGVPLEDLCLTFSLPGYPKYPLKVRLCKDLYRH